MARHKGHIYQPKQKRWNKGKKGKKGRKGQKRHTKKDRKKFKFDIQSSNQPSFDQSPGITHQPQSHPHESSSSHQPLETEAHDNNGLSSSCVVPPVNQGPYEGDNNVLPAQDYEQSKDGLHHPIQDYGHGPFSLIESDRPVTQGPHQGDNNQFHQGDPYLPGHSKQAAVSFSQQYEQQQAQSQIALQRKIQAYFQMLYDVYDYTIGMIEELEKHETHGKQIHNSGILSHLIPVNHKKPIHDVIGGIELELKCLQAQMISLPPEVTNAAKDNLVKQTIRWAASREDQGIPLGPVDHYCKNVLEILLFDAPKELPDVNRAPKITLTTKQVNEAMHQMAVQRHLGEKQDEEFARDPTKEAKLRNKRQTEDLREGALRLTKDDPRLKHFLEEQGYVEDVSMELE